MNAGAFFAAAETLPFATLPQILGGGGLVVVAPHPDDESLGCGGLIAEACALDLAVRLVVVSDGVGSHPASRRYPPAALRALRETETREAAAALGLAADAIRFLRLPDRRVPSKGPEADAASDAIATTAREIGAGAICVSWRHDPHCDHLASADIVEGARDKVGGAGIYAYPIWGWTLPPDRDVGAAPRGWRIDVAHHRDAKRAAIAAHRSQTTNLIDDDPDGFRLTPEMIARFTDAPEMLLETGP